MPVPRPDVVNADRYSAEETWPDGQRPTREPIESDGLTDDTMRSEGRPHTKSFSLDKSVPSFRPATDDRFGD